MRVIHKLFSILLRCNNQCRCILLTKSRADSLERPSSFAVRAAVIVSAAISSCETVIVVRAIADLGLIISIALFIKSSFDSLNIKLSNSKSQLQSNPHIIDKEGYLCYYVIMLNKTQTNEYDPALLLVTRDNHIDDEYYQNVYIERRKAALREAGRALVRDVVSGSMNVGKCVVWLFTHDLPRTVQ